MPVEGQPSGLKQSFRALETVTPRGNAPCGPAECARTSRRERRQSCRPRRPSAIFRLAASTVFARGPANWILCTRHSFLSPSQPLLFSRFLLSFASSLFHSIAALFVPGAATIRSVFEWKIADREWFNRSCQMYVYVVVNAINSVIIYNCHDV